MESHILEKLLEISRQLSQTRSLQPLLEYSLDIVLELISGERGMVILKRGDKLDYRVHRSRDGQSITNPEQETSHSILRKVIDNRTPLKLVNAIDDPEFALSTSVGMLQLRSVMCVPMQVHERLIGVIYVENRSSNGVFRQQELDILSYFAGQAAVAIDNALLNEELEAVVAERTADLEAALNQLREEAAQREKLHQVLADNQNRVDAIVDNAGDAVIIFDENLYVERFNLAAERIFGYTADEICGHHLEILLPENTRENHREHANTFIHSDRRSQLMYSREGIFGRRKNGEIFPAEVSVNKLDTYTGKMYTTILRDISERKRAEAEIQNQNRELNAFAHTVAHDLKNPLASIVGYASMLAGDDLEADEQVMFADRLVDMAMISTRIVDNLLLLATLRQAEVAPQRLDMAEIIEEVQQRLQHQLVKHTVVLHLPHDWHPALGYAGWIEEVWINYISNALKYGGTPPEITLGSEALPHGRVRFWVADNGPGIPLEKQAGLFTEFNRLGEQRAKGHGLGLSIVKRIMDKLGGDVAVESAVGAGSRFSFILPADTTTP
ncbi:MAG: PAS domain S-box protein [Anaerolineales bacterium]